MRVALLLLALAAGKTDPSLVGTWLLAGQPFLTLAANGTGTMEDGKLKWSVEGKTLVIADDEDGVDKAQYQVSGDTLTLTLGGVPLQLTRAGKGVKVEKAGKLSKAVNKQSEADADAEALAEAQQLLAQQQGRAAQAQPAARGAAPARGSAGNDQLSQLLMSSAWCWLKYASGNTYQERIVFSANGTWSSNKESEIYGSNQYAGTSAHSVGASGAQGQWAVKGGQLYLSDPPETPQLVPVPLQITRNSNGYPIITADGTEYSQCN
ncbi:MAG: copper resistance protein NlpE [Archangiaceae bacterium]|nr:copper resistance protein NlpE [Archangiaceae bacterium]